MENYSSNVHIMGISVFNELPQRGRGWMKIWGMLHSKHFIRYLSESRFVDPQSQTLLVGHLALSLAYLLCGYFYLRSRSAPAARFPSISASKRTTPCPGCKECRRSDWASSQGPGQEIAG